MKQKDDQVRKQGVPSAGLPMKIMLFVFLGVLIFAKAGIAGEGTMESDTIKTSKGDLVISFLGMAH